MTEITSHETVGGQQEQSKIIINDLAIALRQPGHDVSDEPRDEQGRWSAGGGDGGGDAAEGFISPNVGTLSFAQAQQALHGGRQQALLKANTEVDKALGKDPASQANAIGAWADGAENSIHVVMPHWTQGQARVAMAMKGWLADQKSVLLFTPSHEGNSFMATFPVKGKLEDIHSQLLKDGIAFHTLEPTKDGALVSVYGDDQATADKIDKAASDNNAKAQFIFGNGEFIGTSKTEGTDREQRDDARAQYEAVIAAAQAGSEFGGRDIGQTWQAIRDRWGTSLSPKVGTQDFDKAGIDVKQIADSPDRAKDFIDTWNARVGKSPAEFKNAFFGNGAVDGRMFLKYDEYHDTIEVISYLENKQGEDIGELNADIHLGDNTAHLDRFRMEKPYTGHDVAKKVLASQFQMYQDMGLRSVDLVANIDVGKYAWARYGFVPGNESEWRELSGAIRGQISASMGSLPTSIPNADAESLRTLAASRDPRALWAIADSKYGKEILGKESFYWEGVLRFNDEGAMARFGAYVHAAK